MTAPGPTLQALDVRERPAQNGCHAEKRKEVRGNHHAGDAVGLCIAGQLVTRTGEEGFVGRELLEGLHPPQNLVGLDREAARRSAAGSVARDPGEPIRPAERQRLEQQAVNHAEHRDVGANAETQHENRDDSERRLAAKLTKRIPDGRR